MAILDEIKAACLIILRTIQNWFGDDSFAIKRYYRHIMMAVGLIAVVSGGYFGYRWYKVSKEQNAHYALADYMQDYQLAVKMNSPAEWQRVETLLTFGYNKHKSSNIAPLFLALRADIQIKQDKLTEAIDTLQQVINALPDNSPISPLFKTKHALILLDSSDEAMQKSGLADMVLLARDKDNQYNDIALFYLGRYYWAQNNMQDAKKAWQELVDSSMMEKAYPSPWAIQATAALKQITT